MSKKNKQLQAAYMRLYRLRKKEPKKGEIRAYNKSLKEAEKKYKKAKKTAHLTEYDILKRKAESSRKKADYYKHKLLDADTRKEQFKIFRKVIKANSERDKLYSDLKKSSPTKRKDLKRKKGIINERYSIWEAKDFLIKLLKNEIKYKKYKGKKFSTQINNINNEMSRISLTANSNDIIVISVNPFLDEIIDIFIKK